MNNFQNIRRCVFFIAFLPAFALSVCAQTVDENLLREFSTLTYDCFETADGIVDERIDFNKNWRFKLGDYPGFEAIGYDDGDWRILDVPHDWSIEGKVESSNPSGTNGGFYPTGRGCYRKSFIMADGFRGKRVKIRFDGVYMNSKVYVNGVYVGNRPYGFSSFEYDISQYLRFNGEKNLVAVSVDNSLQPSCRWYTGSGINRNVYLIVTEQQHFDLSETFFRTVSIDNGSAIVKVDCKVVSNNYPESDRVKFQLWPSEIKYVEKKSKVNVRLRDKNNGIVAETSKDFTLRDYEEKAFSFQMDVKRPQLWSDETPELYKLELELWVDGRMVNSDKRDVGIRMITFDCEKGMLVNGKKVILKGVCLHKDAGSFGTAVPEEMWEYRLEQLKEMGCNAIRVHGPADPVFIDVCDRLGFYMMAEAFDEWENNWEYGISETHSGKLPYTYHLYFNQWAETDLKDMVRRDRNHPSVFMYSVGNEVPEQRYPDGASTLVRLRDWAHETDDTRPVTVGCDWSMWGNRNGFMDSMDVAGYNYPERYYPELYKEQHEQYPHRVLLGTENYITLKNWLAVRDNPFVAGMFLWVGIDYLGESLGWPRRSWEWGLIDLASFPKSRYYTWQAYWSDKPMVHASVLLKDAESFQWRPYDTRSHWNFEREEMDTVFVVSNQPEVELFLNGKSLGRKKVSPNEYRAVYAVEYEKGKLEAVAYNNRGRRVAAHTLRTAGEPYKLSVINQRNDTVFENGKTLFLAVEVQDREGVLNPHAKNEITVAAEGGEILGIDSGDPFSHELYKISRRRAYEGKILVTVRVKDKKAFKLVCTADGLRGCEFALNQQAFK